jgi:hypothetical protein
MFTAAPRLAICMPNAKLPVTISPLIICTSVIIIRHDTDLPIVRLCASLNLIIDYPFYIIVLICAVNEYYIVVATVCRT